MENKVHHFQHFHEIFTAFCEKNSGLYFCTCFHVRRDSILLARPSQDDFLPSATHPLFRDLILYACCYITLGSVLWHHHFNGREEWVQFANSNSLDSLVQSFCQSLTNEPVFPSIDVGHRSHSRVGGTTGTAGSVELVWGDLHETLHVSVVGVVKGDDDVVAGMGTQVKNIYCWR